MRCKWIENCAVANPKAKDEEKPRRKKLAKH